MAKRRVIIAEDLAGLARAAAELLLKTCNAAGATPTVALSGGSTPEALYRCLTDGRSVARAELAGLLRARLCWGDERCVPPDDPRSNYGLARRELLGPLDFSENRIFSPPCVNTDPETASIEYETTLRRVFAGNAAEQTAAAWPRFDLTLLGMGDDGHTASLFPNAPALEEKHRWVVSARQPQTGELRLTLTLPCFNRARRVLFLVAGESKAETLARVFAIADRGGDNSLPASLIEPADGETVWVVDRAAAAKL